MTIFRTMAALTGFLFLAMSSYADAVEPVAPVFRDEDLLKYGEGHRGADLPRQRNFPDDVPREKDGDAVFRENDRSVCAVAAYDAEGRGFSHGSCFIAGQDGIVVTSFHVLSNAASARIRTGKHVYAVEGIIFADREYDVMVLKTDAAGLPAVRLGDSRDTRTGDRVFLMDSPKGTGSRIMQGNVSGLRDIGGRRMIQLSLQLLAGSSGGPIFNVHGEVIGIAAMLVTDGNTVSFAVPVEAVKDRLAGSALPLKEALRRDRRQAADYWVAAGDGRIGAGQYQEALAAYQKALDADPDSVMAYNGIGVVYSRMKRFEDAVAAYGQALKRDPDSAWTRSNLGLAFIELRKYPEAVDALLEAVRSMPELSVAHFNLGIAYAKSEQYRQAAASYKEAIRLSPSMADAYYGLGLVYLALHDRKEALRQYETLKQLDPVQARKLWEKMRE